MFCIWLTGVFIYYMQLIFTELFCDEEVVRGKPHEEKQKYTEIIMDSLEYWKTP